MLTSSSLLERPEQAQIEGLEVEAYILPRCGRNPRFTAARFFSRDPARYRAVVRLSAAYGSHDIADMLGVSVHTVLQVQSREAQSVAQIKDTLARRCLLGARLAAEEILSRLADPEERRKVPANVLGPWVGILVEKHELLTGGVTARVEHVTTEATDPWAAFLTLIGQGIGQGRGKDAAKLDQAAPAAGESAGGTALAGALAWSIEVEALAAGESAGGTALAGALAWSIEMAALAGVRMLPAAESVAAEQDAKYEHTTTPSGGPKITNEIAGART